LRGVLLGAIGGAVGGIEGSQHNIKKATLQIKELLNQPDLMDFDESRPLAKFANDSLESDLDKMDKIRSKSREYLDMGNKEKALPLLYEALLIARSQRSMIEGLRLTTDRFDKGINNLLWLIHNEEWICWNELKYAGFVVSPGLEPPLLPEGVRKALGMKER